MVMHFIKNVSTKPKVLDLKMLWDMVMQFIKNVSTKPKVLDLKMFKVKL